MLVEDNLNIKRNIMGKVNNIWKIFISYLFILLCILLSNSAFSQITVTQFNADWNDANKVEWIEKLTDCEVEYIDIVEDPTVQKKQEIVVVPTIIIFKDEEAVKRYQANISFTMKATREEIQEFIDELLMSDF